MGGKITRIQQELDDLNALIDIMNILKDMATNRFYIFASKKPYMQPYFDAFNDYFELLGKTETTCPLVKNNHPDVDMLLVMSDQNFMSQLNARVARAALDEQQMKYPNANVICVAKRGADRCRLMGLKVHQVFIPGDYAGQHEMALKIKEYFIDRVLSGQTGKVVAIHLWAKSFNTYKPRMQILLPATELTSSEAKEEKSNLMGGQHLSFIPESTVDQSMLALADIWIQSRLLEIIADVSLVEFAVLASQLEQATESLENEKRQLMLEFRKAKREQINKAMREIFIQVKVVKGKGAAV